MEKLEVDSKLKNRILETYEERIKEVRVNKELTGEFWTETGVRQGCPLSPSLFNLYLKDLEEEMEKSQLGGIIFKKPNVWTISYADYIILIAQRESELKYMMKRFRKYLKKKELTLSPDKSKVFEKGKGRKKSRTWSWENKEVEEVGEIKYLGYILKKMELAIDRLKN